MYFRLSTTHGLQGAADLPTPPPVPPLRMPQPIRPVDLRETLLVSRWTLVESHEDTSALPDLHPPGADVAPEFPSPPAMAFAAAAPADFCSAPRPGSSLAVALSRNHLAALPYPAIAGIFSYLHSADGLALERTCRTMCVFRRHTPMDMYYPTGTWVAVTGPVKNGGESAHQVGSACRASWRAPRTMRVTTDEQLAWLCGELLSTSADENAWASVERLSLDVRCSAEVWDVLVQVLPRMCLRRLRFVAYPCDEPWEAALRPGGALRRLLAQLPLLEELVVDCPGDVPETDCVYPGGAVSNPPHVQVGRS
ncbi:hypothetical protein BD413DRAFT_42784 [Trametes elegans]|nr:hypothetical protein BD413DRAFT_42784 [Trametes elegans]